MDRKFIALVIMAACAFACGDDDAGRPTPRRDAAPDSERDAHTTHDAAFDGATDQTEPDASSRRVTTAAGEMTCLMAGAHIAELFREAVSANNECDLDDDCVCARADTECDSRCEVAISSERTEQFAGSLEDISEFFGLPQTCPCGHTDSDCSTCVPNCVRGRCTYGVSVDGDAGTD